MVNIGIGAMKLLISVLSAMKNVKEKQDKML